METLYGENNIKYIRVILSNTTARKAFLEDLGNNVENLRNAGFSETDILKIQNGRVPDGWQVHHKLPLDDSGTNSFDNLVLIQNEPYHKVITNYQNSIARQMKIGAVQAVQYTNHLPI